MTLLELQTTFREALLVDECDLSAPFGDGAAPGLVVYRNAYRARLVDCLRSGYDKVLAWAGDEAFDAAAAHHIILNPPHSWTLDDYGHGFEATLTALFAGDPEVADLAWLEWTMQHAFGSPDGPVVTPVDLTAEAMADFDWDRATFEFVGSLDMRMISSNCTGIWLALTNETEMPEQIILDAPAVLSVWRKEFSPQFLVLGADEYRALTMAMAGATFGEMCEALAEDSDGDEAAAAAGGMLGRWIGEGMISVIGAGA
jgi:hypothetical protein